MKITPPDHEVFGFELFRAWHKFGIEDEVVNVSGNGDVGDGFTGGKITLLR